MKILTEGHRYELADMEGEGSQVLQFIEKRKTEKDYSEAPEEWMLVDEHRRPVTPPPDGNLDGLLRVPAFVTVNNGTTNEEVLAMLIDRMNYLQGKAPCRENALVITKLEESLMWLNKRTADRVARNVEGTPAV